MIQERLTKVQRKERAGLVLSEQQRRAKQQRLLVRGGVTAGVLVVFLGIGFAAWQSSRPDDQLGPANMISGGALFTGVDGEARIVKTEGMSPGSDPVPTDPEKYDAPARIVTYIDFGCEYCKAFEAANAQQIEEMVAAGEATLEVQPVAITGEYAVRSGSAMSCLVAQQPEDFFTALSAMYENQPPEGGSWSNSQILDIWSTAGIDASSDLTSCVTSEQYADWIQSRTDDVTSDPQIVNPATGSFGTPTVFVNGERFQPQDLTDPQEFAAFVEANSKAAA